MTLKQMIWMAYINGIISGFVLNLLITGGYV